MFSRVIAALALVLLVGAHGSSTRFLCSLTGQVSTHCCCAEGDDTSVRADTECCDVLRSGGELPEATAPRSVSVPAPSAVLLPQPELFRAAQPFVELTAHALDPPPNCATLFTLHCSFLI